LAAAVAIGATLTLGLAGCQPVPGSDTSNVAPAFNAALEKVYNPSDKKGGIVKMASASDWDFIDPGD
jgi:peptide/nickel transport system substrate-binding protein